MSAARATAGWTLALLAALGIGTARTACAAPPEDVQDAPKVAGRVVTRSDPDSVATTMIQTDRGDARVAGERVRRVVIHGDVETGARNGASACTSIGSIGGCGERPNGAHVEIGTSE